MIENIIFYGIAIFFSLIALGASWQHKLSYPVLTPLIACGTPLIMYVIYIYNPSFLNEVFSIKALFINTEHKKGIVGYLLLCIGYLVHLYFFIYQVYGHITRRSKSQPAAAGTPQSGAP